MTFGLFPDGFGQGTGISRGHADFLEQMNQVIAGGHPRASMAKRLVNKIVYVDPVNGDDHLANDGTVTPLKTLDVLSKRLPEAMVDVTEAAYLGRAKIKLLPGEYEMTSDLLLRIPPNVKLEGSFGEVESFEADSIDANLIDIYKSGATPAWTTGQFREMFIMVDFYGLFQFLFPILDSGDHWIRLAWDGPGYAGTITPGSTVSIVDLESIIRGNGFLLTMDLGTSSFVGEIDIDGAQSTSVFGDAISFFGCRFSNGTYGLLTQKGYKIFQQCLFRDMSSAGIFVVHGGSNMIRGCAFARCSDAIKVDWQAIVSFLFEVSYFKDCPEAIKGGGRPGIQIYYDLDDLYCENVTDFIKNDTGGNIHIATALTSAVDSKLPTNLITAKNGSKIALHAGSTLEATTNTLNINGTISTMANFFAGGGHNGWIEDQNGNHVFVRT